LTLAEKVAALSTRILGAEHHATFAAMHDCKIGETEELDDIDLDEEDSEDLGEEVLKLRMYKGKTLALGSN